MTLDDAIFVADMIYKEHCDFARASHEYSEAYARSVACLGMRKRNKITPKRELVAYFEQLAAASWDALTHYLVAVNLNAEKFGVTGEEVSARSAKYTRKFLEYDKIDDLDDLEDVYLEKE
jgi:hypothetical protein